MTLSSKWLTEVVKLRDGMIRKNYLNETKLTAAELDW